MGKLMVKTTLPNQEPKIEKFIVNMSTNSLPSFCGGAWAVRPRIQKDSEDWGRVSCLESEWEYPPEVAVFAIERELQEAALLRSTPILFMSDSDGEGSDYVGSFWNTADKLEGSICTSERWNPNSGNQVVGWMIEIPLDRDGSEDRVVLADEVVNTLTLYADQTYYEVTYAPY